MKRKTPNLAIANDLSTNVFYASFKCKVFQKQAKGVQGTGAQEPTVDSFGRWCGCDGLGNSDNKQKVGALRCGANVVVVLRDKKLETTTIRSLRRLVCETTRKRRRIGSPVGMLKTRSCLWVCHLITQQSSHSGRALSRENYRSASWMV